MRAMEGIMSITGLINREMPFLQDGAVMLQFKKNFATYGDAYKEVTELQSSLAQSDLSDNLEFFFAYSYSEDDWNVPSLFHGTVPHDDTTINALELEPGEYEVYSYVTCSGINQFAWLPELSLAVVRVETQDLRNSSTLKRFSDKGGWTRQFIHDGELFEITEEKFYIKFQENDNWYKNARILCACIPVLSKAIFEDKNESDFSKEELAEKFKFKNIIRALCSSFDLAYELSVLNYELGTTLKFESADSSTILDIMEYTLCEEPCMELTVTCIIHNTVAENLKNSGLFDRRED